MINRNIFTTRRNWGAILDVALAVTIGLSLCLFILHSLDALFY